MSDPASFRLSKIGVIMLSVTDMARSLEFYRDRLGLPVAFASGEFAFLDAGGTTLALRGVARLPPVEEVRTELVFQVDDVAEAHRALTARGVAFRVEPRPVSGDDFAADFRDPDGHVLSVFGKKRS